MGRVIRAQEQVQVDEDLLEKLYYGEQVKACSYPYTNYFATSFGRIFSGKEIFEFTTVKGQKIYSVCWKELKTRVVNGYEAVNITYKENSRQKRKTEYVHTLVYEAFNYKLDRRVLKIVHLDRNKLNNHLSNLHTDLLKKNDYREHRLYAYRQIRDNKK